MEGETAWHVAFALYHKRIENGSESQTRHDWQRRPGVTSATTDLEMVDLSRTMSAPSAHWARTSGPPAQQLRNLAFVTFGGARLGLFYILVTSSYSDSQAPSDKPPPGPFVSSSPTPENRAMHASVSLWRVFWAAKCEKLWVWSGNSSLWAARS